MRATFNIRIYAFSAFLAIASFLHKMFFKKGCEFVFHLFHKKDYTILIDKMMEHKDFNIKMQESKIEVSQLYVGTQNSKIFSQQDMVIMNFQKDFHEKTIS